MSAADILVIILSVTLAVFLIVSIILVVLLIQVTKRIRDISNTAQRVVGNVERFTTNVSTLVAPATLFNLIKKVVRRR